MGSVFRVVLFALALMAAAAGRGAEAAADGERITVTNYGDMDPVSFNHTNHAGQFDCTTCHHPRDTQGAHRCGACHRANERGRAMKIEDAAHKEKVGKCWGCHLSPTARRPFDCDDCHGRKP
jgi:hypothetical protein